MDCCGGTVRWTAVEGLCDGLLWRDSEMDCCGGTVSNVFLTQIVHKYTITTHLLFQ